MKTIIHAVHVHAAPAAVFRALSTADGLRGWWTTQASLTPGVGGVIRFTFHGDFHPEMRQDVLERNRRIQWRCVGGHPNWQDNVFTFALEEREGETFLRFVQEYAQELSDDVYGVYNFNWGYYLNSLKQLCETGTGAPFVPPP